MPAALAAAHIAHEIEHSSALMGFLIGAAVGLLVGVAIVATVATGGAALAVVAAVGGAIASTGGGALAGKYIGEAIKNPKGPISSGSPNVFYGPARKAAARAIIDTVACKDHGTKFLATGSDSVFINEYPSVRDDDKSECDGTVHSDIDHIFIGAETVQYLEIDPEVPEWMVNIAQGMVIVGGAVALVFGAAAALAAGGICALINFGGSVLGGMLGSAILAPLGGEIGEALFGEVGRRIGETGFAFLGGLLGGGLGNRLSSGHPVDVATGELFTSNAEFVIGGLISVTWERFWISSSTQQGALGSKWHHPLDMALAPAGGYWVLRLEAGRLILLPDLQPGQSFYHRSEKLVATRLSDDDWTIRKSNGLSWLLQSDPSGRVPYRLAEIRDDNANHLSLSYDARGNLAEVVATDGIRYRFISDGLDRITAIERLAGEDRTRLVDYAYDDKGDLVAATDRSGIPFGYEYARHLMRRETRRSGLTFHFEWDDIALGIAARCTKTWGDGNIYYREFEYRPEISQTRVRNFEGATETYHYNDIGLVTEVTTPLGHRNALTFNRFAEILTSTDANGVETRWQRDAYGRTVTLFAPDGAQTRFEYASDDPQSPVFDAVSRQVNAEGGETSAEYDARGNLVSYTDPLGYSVRILRDQRGLPLSQQDGEGVLERLSWTGDGNLREHRSPKGGGVRYDYDHLGRLVGQKVEGMDPVAYEYDAQDRPVTTRFADGTSTTQVYDADGRVVQVTQPGGQVHRWEYRGLPDPVLRINPDGTRFAYEYDTELNLIALRNEVGDVYRREYDADQRLIRETGFDGRNQEFAYDPSGCIIHATDGARWHRFSRDKAGRLLRRDSSDDSWSTFAYDAMGRLSRADNQARSLAFAYDLRGLVLSETQDGQEIAHAYDPRGHRVTTMLPDGRFFGFGYDQNGSFERLTFAGREVLKLSHDRIGRERLRSAGHLALETDYDPQGRISQQLAYREGRRGPVFGRSFGHDQSGLIDRISDLTRGDRRFAYDPREQLVEVTGEGAERFGFDPAGNLLKDVEDPRDASVRQGRLMMRGDSHYDYDDAGNRVTLRRGQGGAHVCHYEYDALNQLVGIRESKGRTQRRTQFAYDALGRRISKSHTEVMTAANLSRRPGQGRLDDAPELVRQDTTWFLWNGNVMLAEGKGDPSGTADPLAVVYVFEPDSFRPAAQIRRHAPEKEGDVLIYWVDHLGTPQEITNERGELVWQVALNAWGGIGQVFHERVENNIRFQGQYHDVETGLHYNRFRHYDPSTGCFINQDPVGLLGGDVLAGYVGNPNQWYDPLGLNDWNDHQHNNPGKTSAENRQTYTPKPRPSTGGTHGNTLNNRPAVLYAITDKHGNFQKWGITQNTANPRSRYITIDGKDMDVRHLPRDFRIERVAIGTRVDMEALERSLTSQAGGKHNNETHSSSTKGLTSTLAGQTERIRAGDPRFTERQRLAINNALSMGCKF